PGPLTGVRFAPNLALIRPNWHCGAPESARQRRPGAGQGCPDLVSIGGCIATAIGHPMSTPPLRAINPAPPDQPAVPAPAGSASAEDGVPDSVKIRERLKAAQQRFHANDNIAEFIEPGELDALLTEVATKMSDVLSSLVIDTDSDHNTQDTARRVAKMYLNEIFKGRYHAPPAITEFPNAERLNELMIVGPVTVRSACSHHLCPIIGRVWIGVMPNEHSNLIGLSKYARLVD